MPDEQARSDGTTHHPRWSRAHRFAVITILLVAGVLRFAALDRYPLPVHQDELSDIYDGSCLAKTGADRSGDHWPVLIRGIGPGDYHPPAYVYLAAIPGYFAGFSIGWGRLPAAMAGLLTVWLVYLTTRRLFDNRLALLALLFVAFSPIHILYSRQAHVGVCLVPLCLVAIVYLLVRLTQTIESKHVRCSHRWAMIAGFVMGLSTNTYSGQRLTAFLFGCAALVMVGWMLIVRRRDARLGVGMIAALALAAIIGAAPQLYALAAQPEHFVARAARTVYPLYCGFQWWGERLLKSLALNLDPTYLFLSFGEYSLLSIARLNVASLPFLYLGLIVSCVLPFLYRRPVSHGIPNQCGPGQTHRFHGQALPRCGPLRSDGQRIGFQINDPDACLTMPQVARHRLHSLFFGNAGFIWIPLGIMFSLTPALITEGNPSSMRSSGVWALYPIVSALGVAVLAQIALFLTRKVQNLFRMNRDEAAGRQPPQIIPSTPRRCYALSSAATALVSVLIVGAGTVDVARYLSRPDLHGPAAQNHFVRIADWIAENDADYDRIYVDAPGMFGYLYLAAFTGMDADDFQNAPREGSIRGLGWDEYHRFGRFYFGSRAQAHDDWLDEGRTGKWLVIDETLLTETLIPDEGALTAIDTSAHSVP